MKRRPYKTYLDPTSDREIPRSTFYKYKQREKIQYYASISSSLDIEQEVSSADHDRIENEECDNNITTEHADHSGMQFEGNVNNQEPWDQFDIIDNEDYSTDNNVIDYSTEDFHDDSPNDNHLREKLCNCTTTNTAEAIAMMLAIGFKHSLTWDCIIDMFCMINSLFGKDIIPMTKYKLFQYFPLANDMITYHLICRECNYYFGKRSDLNITSLLCNNCNRTISKSDFSFFIMLDVPAQLKQLLEDSDVQKELQYRFDRFNDNKTHIHDIYDGEMYKKSVTSKYDLSYTFSSDGCQTSKSSRMSAWPIYIMLHELPLHLRTKHILMVGLWVGEQEPDMNIFFQPFIEEANLLSNEGITWKLNGIQVNSRILPLCGCFDSVARCKVLNMKQYNGWYKCTFCEHQGEHINDNNIRFTISTNVPPHRTDDAIKKLMIQQAENHLVQDIKGVKGPSILMNLSYFDLADGMIPDYMHSVLLGVIKQHTELLLSNVGKDYYIGDPTSLLQLNNRLLAIKHPSCITRAARKIEDRHLWKALEWRSWMLFYSLLCLNGILKTKYLRHLALLVLAIELLLNDNLTREDIDNADTSLIKYVVLYQKYFGKLAMTYNVHLLLHLHKSVTNWGPLFTHNAFCFESENRFLLQLRKSPAHVTLQIAKKYCIKKSLQYFLKDIEKSTHFQLFCGRVLSSKLKNVLNINDCILIGSGNDYNLSSTEKILCNYSGNCKLFNRIIVNRFRYTTENYRQCKTLNDSIIITKCGKRGIITKICYCPGRLGDEIVIIYKEMSIVQNSHFLQNCGSTITHIKRCNIGTSIQVCHPDSLSKQGFLISMNTINYFVMIPKGCYDD